MTALLALIATSSPAHALEHTVAFRYRYGAVPRGLLDIWYFDGDDGDGAALGYTRPGVSANVFGLEYTAAPEPTGGPSFVGWIERIPIRMDAGYWDDKETPPDHNDGDWLQPEKGLGMWALGANYLHEVPLSSTDKPVWVSLAVGGGLGIGFLTGSITTWHAGYHEESLDPTCGPLDVAPDRYATCQPDGEVNLPGVVPILDLSVGPKIHLTEHAMVRLDFGLHDVLFAGIAAGGSF